MTMTGAQAARLAAEYVGSDSSRFRAEYKRLTGKETSGDWCCVFASAIVCGWAGAKLEGLPSTWCPDARVAATSAGRQVDLSEARAGDVAYFEFTGNDRADHVGIVESYHNGVLTTIDGNVSNRVGRRSRSRANWRKVWVVRPTYAAEAKQAAAKLLVDGIFGTVTCSALQRRLAALGYYKAAVDGVFGPLTKRAYQMFLRDKGYYGGIIDGIFGVMSVKAEQRWLASVGCYPGAIDGARGPLTKKGLQMALNGGKL